MHPRSWRAAAPQGTQGRRSSATISYAVAKKQTKSWWGSGLPPFSHAGPSAVPDKEWFCFGDFGRQHCPALQTPSSAVSGDMVMHPHHATSPAVLALMFCVTAEGRGSPGTRGPTWIPLLQISVTTSWRWWGWRVRWRWGRFTQG